MKLELARRDIVCENKVWNFFLVLFFFSFCSFHWFRVWFDYSIIIMVWRDSRSTLNACNSIRRTRDCSIGSRKNRVVFMHTKLGSSPNASSSNLTTIVSSAASVRSVPDVAVVVVLEGSTRLLEESAVQDVVPVVIVVSAVVIAVEMLVDAASVVAVVVGPICRS